MPLHQRPAARAAAALPAPQSQMDCIEHTAKIYRLLQLSPIVEFCIINTVPNLLRYLHSMFASPV